MKFIFATLFALILLTAPNGAIAQPAGSDSTAFQHALAAWLDDDDQTALPALAKLAREDNRAAQVLLGRIATRPMGSWLAGLERKERKELLRAPGGLSGTSWLKVAAEAGDYLSWMFIQAEDPRVGAKMVRAFVDAGEDTAAGVLVARLAQKWAVDEGAKLFKMMHERKTPKDANYLIGRIIPKNIVELTPDLNRIGRFSPILDETFGFPFNMMLALNAQPNELAGLNMRLRRQLFKGIAPPVNDAQLAVAGADEEQAPYIPKPLDILWNNCTATCGSSDRERNMCVMRSMNLIGGYEQLRTLGSPTEVLIPHETFRTSTRAAADLGRHAQLLMRAFPQYNRQAHIEVNGCANEVLNLN